MRAPRVGLLPLYIKLYDEIDARIREGFRGFLAEVATLLRKEGVEVTEAPICCVRGEFEKAVKGFEKANVDLIATLHIAYSPSGESIDALCETEIPLLMLDTTMDYGFGQDVPSARLLYDHGIHGVQDLAAMFRRRGRQFQIVAGHYKKSDVIKRAAEIARAALAARSLRGTKVLRIGRPFASMDDFAVAPAVLKRQLGITMKQIAPEALAPAARAVSEKEIDAEVAADRKLYRVYAPKECHRRSVRLGLGIRRYLQGHGFSAFSANFLDFNSKRDPVSVVPFLEASKAMARGVGYAGEGDVLTAALTGALIKGFRTATFAEIFCPDWKGNSLFLSHMGEINPLVAAARPTLEEKQYSFSNALNPAFLSCAPKEGPAVYVNLSPGPDETFRLIAAPVTVMKDSRRADYRGVVRGWMRPEGTVAEFLEEYSRLGGTHHSVLVLGARMEAVEAFAAMSEVEFVAVGRGKA